MKLYHKFIVLLICIITLGCVICIGQGMPSITVTIKGQGLTIGTPANIELVNFSNGKEFTFDDYFWIEDLRASKTGHYTSIQGLVYGGDGNIISGATVTFNTNTSSIRSRGEEDNTEINSINDIPINNPVLLFYRANDLNHSLYFNKYGFKPSIRVTVPSGSEGPYTVRLSYTLYDMPMITQ